LIAVCVFEGVDEAAKRAGHSMLSCIFASRWIALKGVAAELRMLIVLFKMQAGRRHPPATTGLFMGQQKLLIVQPLRARREELPKDRRAPRLP
jgi:hypothetical protein